MHNALDSITSSFITSASPVANSGSKADAHQAGALDEHFSGLLNQAFHGQKTGTQQADHAPAQKNQSASQPKARSQAEDATSGEQEKTATASTEESEETQDQQPVQSADKKEQVPSAEDVQALLQSLQPLALTILKTTHLLGQNNMEAAQASEAGENEIAPVAEQTTAVGTGSTATLNLPGNASTLSLLTGTGSQHMLAFALPGKTQADPALSGPNGQIQTSTPEVEQSSMLSTPEASSAEQDLMASRPAANSVEQDSLIVIPADANGQTQQPQSQIEIPITKTESPLPSDNSTELPATATNIDTPAKATADTVNNGNTPSQSTFVALASELPKDGVQALDSSRQSRKETGSVKPNASLPSAETFQKTLTNLHQSLNELNGEIEPVNGRSSDQGTDRTETAENLDASAGTTDSAAPSTADLFSALGGAIASTGAERTNDNAAPTFTSLAPNPLDQVAEGAAYGVKHGQKELIIRLNPDNLGEVRVNLTSHGNQELSARLIASTVESHDLLKGQLESLKNTLESQGVTVERLSVVLAGHTENSNGASSQHQQSSGGQDRQPDQQHNTQQGSNFQQQYNPQNPASSLFGQMGGQSQPGWAQRLNHSTNTAATDSVGSEQGTGTTPQAAAPNDNGRISILA